MSDSIEAVDERLQRRREQTRLRVESYRRREDRGESTIPVQINDRRLASLLVDLGLLTKVPVRSATKTQLAKGLQRLINQLLVGGIRVTRYTKPCRDSSTEAISNADSGAKKTC